MSEVFRSWWILNENEVSAALASGHVDDVMDALEILFSKAFHAGIRCAIRAAEEIEKGKQERVVDALIHSIEQEKQSPPVCEVCKGSGYVIKRDGNCAEWIPCTPCIKVP